VAGALVTISFNGGIITDVTAYGEAEPYPYYARTADSLGARRGDWLTITVSYAGEVISRVIRAFPDEIGDQEVAMVFPHRGYWEHFGDSGLVRAIVFSDTTLWAGGPWGLARWDVKTGLSETVDSGLPSKDVWALILDNSGHLWVGTSGGVAEYDGTSWRTHDTGLASDKIHALTVNRFNGHVWVGASDTQNGGVAEYDGSTWQAYGDFNGSRPNAVEALEVDENGHLWVGTAGGGASRWDGATWETFTTDEGLNSNYVYALAAEPGGIWFGTRAYWTAQGELGGVSRYDLDDGAWEVYTSPLGLPLPNVYSIAIDGEGRKWFGTWGNGIAVLDDRFAPSVWVTYTMADGLITDNIRTLAWGAGTMWAGTPHGIERLVDEIPGQPPECRIITPSASFITISVSSSEVIFSGEGRDNDEGGSSTVAYEWRSDLDGPLSTFASFDGGSVNLSPGLHRITFRVQDDEGVWSEPCTVTVAVLQQWRVYLPVVVKH